MRVRPHVRVAWTVLATAGRGRNPDPVTWSLIGEVALYLLVFVVISAMIWWLGRRLRRAPGRVTDEWSSRAQMDALCPGGWQARITVYGSNSPVPRDAPSARRPQVSVDWAELRGGTTGHGEVAVVRRVWAPDISTALAAMVRDRRTDAALEEIERALSPDDAETWQPESE